MLLLHHSGRMDTWIAILTLALPDFMLNPEEAADIMVPSGIRGIMPISGRPQNPVISEPGADIFTLLIPRYTATGMLNPMDFRYVA